MGVYKEVRVKIIPYFKCTEIWWIFKRGLTPIEEEQVSDFNAGDSD